MDQERQEGRDFWFMPSNSGRERFECIAVSGLTNCESVMCELRLKRAFFTRRPDREIGGPIPDYSIALHQVELDTASLEGLRRTLAVWPDNETAFFCELGAKPLQEFSLSINRDEKYTYSLGMWACTLTYNDGPAMSACWAYLVDQSCIRLCAESLGAFLKSASVLQQ